MAERLEDLQFENLKIYQDDKGYCFTSDAVLLANYAKFLAGSKVVEFCAGSGVISILLSKKQKPKSIHSFEIMKEPYELSKKSVEYNNLTDKVFPINDKLENSVNILGRGFADVVVCNPPYLKTDNKYSQTSTLTEVAKTELLTTLESVIENAEKLLKFGGKLYMVHRTDRLVDVLTQLRKNKLEPKKLTIIHPNEKAEPVVFLVEAHKGGKVGLKVSKLTFATEYNKA